MANVKDIIGKGASVVGEVADRAERFARTAGQVAQGVQRRAGGGREQAARPAPKAGMDDKTLQAKVESIVFRPSGAPKGAVDVNVADGVVYLHGEVKTPAKVKAIEAAVRAVPEVRDVENLLHLPKTPAATRADAPKRQQKSRTTRPRSATSAAAKRKPRVSTEKSKAAGEPTPDELAAKRQGRQAAPMGSSDPDAASSISEPGTDAAAAATTKRLPG